MLKQGENLKLICFSGGRTCYSIRSQFDGECHDEQYVLAQDVVFAKTDGSQRMSSRMIRGIRIELVLGRKLMLGIEIVGFYVGSTGGNSIRCESLGEQENACWRAICTMVFICL